VCPLFGDFVDSKAGGNTLHGSSCRIELIYKIMNKTIETAVTLNEAGIDRLAYQLWENAGRPAGRDLEFWLAAEAQARAAATQPSAPESAEASPVKPSKTKEPKAPRSTRGGIKKTWPKPYPSLPRF
jgi:hypothetical protein